MIINYKTIIHERKEDAPFVGALVSAIGCNFKCKGCFNRHLKAEPTLTATSEAIVAEILSNPFNKGIILAGLEWSEQPQEMLELASTASKAGLQVMIYTGCTLSEFQTIVGKSCAEKVGYASELEKEIHDCKDDEMYVFIGGMILDTMIQSEYYVKCGRYDKTLLSPERSQFGVSLASSNQIIYKFITEVEDK